MDAFRVVIDGQHVDLTKGLAPGTNSQPLTGAETVYVKSSFGTLSIDSFQGHQFSIFRYHFSIRHTVSIGIEQPPGLFTMHTPMDSHLQLDMNGRLINFRPQQVNFYNQPAYTIQLQAGQPSFELLAINFTKEWLSPYAIVCPRLANLLLTDGKGQLISMLESPQYLSIDEIHLLNRVLKYDQSPALAGNYYSSILHVFMLSMVPHVNSLLDAGACDPLDLEKAAKVREIILSDFENYHTVEALARQVRMAEMKLQLAFKQLYGTTVMNFSRDARLEQGLALLTSTDYPLRVICMMVGYDDPSNFSCAFKKKFGYWPGYIRKSTKQTN